MKHTMLAKMQFCWYKLFCARSFLPVLLCWSGSTSPYTSAWRGWASRRVQCQHREYSKGLMVILLHRKYNACIPSGLSRGRIFPKWDKSPSISMTIMNSMIVCNLNIIICMFFHCPVVLVELADIIHYLAILKVHNLNLGGRVGFAFLEGSLLRSYRCTLQHWFFMTYLKFLADFVH